MCDVGYEREKWTITVRRYGLCLPNVSTLFDATAFVLVLKTLLLVFVVSRTRMRSGALLWLWLSVWWDRFTLLGLLSRTLSLKTVSYRNFGFALFRVSVFVVLALRCSDIMLELALLKLSMIIPLKLFRAADFFSGYAEWRIFAILMEH